MMSGGMFFFLFQNCLNITKPPCPETLLSGLGCWDSALPWETLSITTHDLGMSVAFLHYFWPILFRLFLQLWCLVHIPRVQQIVQTYFCRELLLACWGWVDKTRQIFFLKQLRTWPSCAPCQKHPETLYASRDSRGTQFIWEAGFSQARIVIVFSL